MPLDADASARLIDLAGTPDFASLLLELASSLGGIDEVFGFAVDRTGTHPLASASQLDHQDIRVREYARRFYRQDPANDVCPGLSGTAPGQGFARAVRSEQIVARDYRRICFDEPDFAGKTCFGWRGPKHTIVLNFYSKRHKDGASLQTLASLADVALAALNRRMAARDESALLPLLERRLASEYPQLAPRERQVIARSILGQNSGTIAIELGTSPGTVLTYRQRAYQKYDFGSAAGFLARLI